MPCMNLSDERDSLELSAQTCVDWAAAHHVAIHYIQPGKPDQNAFIEHILAYRHLPLEHQRQLHSTNPLERLNQGDETPIERGRDLPDATLSDPLGRRDPSRAGR